MSKKISAENMMLHFPRGLAIDESKKILAKIVADELEDLYLQCDRIGVFNRIDVIPEELLDVLAVDLDVKWYDYNAELDKKRSLIKSSFYVHRHLGTKSAMESAISSLYSDSSVSEWFEYGGDPHHFTVSINVSDESIPFSEKDVRRLIDMFKPASAELDTPCINFVNTLEHYIGIIAWTEKTIFIDTEGYEFTLLKDENGVTLTDENGAFIINR